MSHTQYNIKRFDATGLNVCASIGSTCLCYVSNIACNQSKICILSKSVKIFCFFFVKKLPFKVWTADHQKVVLILSSLHYHL